MALQEVEKRKFGVRGKKQGAGFRGEKRDESQARAGEGVLRETESFPGADSKVEVNSSISETGKTQGIELESRESNRRRSATVAKVLTKAPMNIAGCEGAKVGTKGKRSRHIPKSVRAEVFERDGGACVFVEPKTGRSCGSSFGLEWDHKLEFSRGGESSEANLRLLCRQHNNQRRMWEREL
ncbi:MAG: HNH endonuclease [Bradymonadales bacterium]|nr:MAG: HNH endonuclease [Bradymonadales bacterium]